MQRLRGLDALRGMAAMLVLMQHVFGVLADDGQRWASVIITTVDLGKFGVCLFFLISGFVIPFSFQRGLVGFGISRAARLLPALWLSILFCLALGADLKSGEQLLANALMLTHALGQTNLADPYWTLCWELYFYGIVALAFAFRLLDSPRTFAALALVCACVSPLEPRLTYLIFMFVGALLRMVLLEGNEAAKLCLFTAIVSLVGSVASWAIFQHRPPEFFVGMALALPVFLLLWNRLSHPALLWLGGISYSLYLFHFPIVQALAGLPPLPFAVLSTSLSMLVAWAVYRWLEKPMIAFGKRITNSVPHNRQVPALPCPVPSK